MAKYTKYPSPTRRALGLVTAFLLIASLLPLIAGTSELVQASENSVVLESWSIYESTATATEHTVDKPSGTADGDLLVAAMSTDGVETLTPPNGWIAIIEDTKDAMTFYVWYKIASSEPDDYTFTVSASEACVLSILRFSGHDSSNPINVLGSVKGYDIAPNCPDVTTTVDDTLVLRLFGADDDDVTEDSGYPDGLIGVFVRGSDEAGGEASAGAAYIVQESAGATGTAAFSLTSSEQWIAVTIAIAPTEEAPSEKPEKPVLITPENNYSTSDNTPTFTWTAGSGATSHRIVIDNSQNFDDGENIYDNANLGGSATSCMIENELSPDNYWWKVCATNAEGDNWSDNTWTFEITAIANPPGKPVLVTPENNYSTSDNTPTFTWATGSNATSHRLVIDNDSTFSDGDNIYDNANLGGSDTSCTIENELPVDNYWWKVCASNAEGDNWSENTWTFEITAIVNVAPIAENQKVEGLTTFTPTLSWDYFDAEGDTQENFHIQVGTSENANDLWDSNQQSSDSHTTYAGSVLDENVTYHWRVRVYDDYEWSGWLYGGTFIISIPPPITPEGCEMPGPVLLVMLTLILMVLAMSFDSPILASFGGISSIFVGLLLLDELWVGSIFLGLGMYFMLTAVLSEWED